MIAALTNHLWQSTLFVLAAGVVAFTLRKNGAHIRHRVWMIASLKFLVPFSVLMSVGSALPTFALSREHASFALDAPALSVTLDRFAQPFSDDVLFPATVSTDTMASTNWIAIAIVGVWACGVVAAVCMRVRGWRRVRAAVRASAPLNVVDGVPVRSAPGLLEPGVVGLWRPVLLVPEGIEQQLTPRQFDAVLTHELCHVQRRDNVTSAIHMVVEAAFWFHPLVWLVGAKLVDERERACDEHVLRVCGEPRVYAESILNVCKLYVESPLACVSGVSGADLKKRIAAIMSNQVARQLSVARKAALVGAAVFAIVLPLAAGMVVAPARAAALAQVAASAAQSVPPNGTYPKFDVVSVKQCEPNAPGQSRGGGGTPITSPGRLYLQCYPLSTMLPEAYLYFADGRAHALSAVTNVGVEGGPDWMKSDRYTIEATMAQVVPAAVMRGPMLQAVLEDRFKLKVQRVTRELPVYELVIAKSGAKVTPYTGHDCVIRDYALWPPPALPAGQSYCGDRSRLDGDRFVREGIMTLDELASLFGFDRPVVNKTGITAPVSYRVEFAKEDSVGGEAPRGSWLNALRNQLGLDLRESKGPRDFLVIDHAERPRPNGPADSRLRQGSGEPGSPR